MYHQLYFQPPLSCFHAHLLAPSHIYMASQFYYIYMPIVEKQDKGVENKVDGTLKLAMFLECAQW